MNRRFDDVAAYIASAEKLFQSEKLPHGGRDVAARVFERLRTPSDDGARRHTRYPACDWLDAALAPFIGDDTGFGAAARAVKALEADIGWARRSSGANGSDGYIDAHVNGMICGPGGAESRYDVQLGFSLMLPHTRYPDHSHPPEEAYVLFTPGEFRQNGGDWIDPGVGGGIHNLPSAPHAMRSGDAVFFAVWCLLTDSAR